MQFDTAGGSFRNTALGLSRFNLRGFGPQNLNAGNTYVAVWELGDGQTLNGNNGYTPYDGQVVTIIKCGPGVIPAVFSAQIGGTATNYQLSASGSAVTLMWFGNDTTWRILNSRL